MKYKFEISIAEIKELGAGPFEFKIALDSMEQSLFDTDTFEIYGEGNFALGISSNDNLLGGFRIPMSCLHRVTSSWFPITSPYTDLDSLPESVSGERVLLTILEISVLSPVQEHREVSEYSLQSTPRNFSLELIKTEEIDSQEIYTAQLSHMLEINRKEIFELKELYEASKRALEKVADEGSKREDELGKHLTMVIEANSRLESENAKLAAEQMRISIENQSLKSALLAGNEEVDKFKNLFRESEAGKKEVMKILAKSQERVEEMRKKENEFQVLIEEKASLMTSVKNLTDKVRDLEKSKENDEKLNNQVSVLNNTISSLKLEIVELRKMNKFLQEENLHYKDIIDKSRSSTTKQDYDTPEVQEHLKSAPIRLSNTNRDDKMDNIDRALRDYMRESGLVNPFSKISEGVYQYGTKKISLSLKNGMPVIRVGGGYMFIDEFLKIYNGQIKKKPENEFCERSLSLEGKIGRVHEKFSDEVDENFPDMLHMTPSESPLKKKVVSSIAYPTKSAILKKIPRLNTHNRELTPNSRRNRTPRQVFLP